MDAGYAGQGAFLVKSAEKSRSRYFRFSGHYYASACQLGHPRWKEGPVNSTQDELFSRYGPGQPDERREVEVRALPSVKGRGIDYHPVGVRYQPEQAFGRKPNSPRVVQNYEVPAILQESCKVEHIKGRPATVITLGAHFPTP
jgi:hypothetical protein